MVPSQAFPRYSIVVVLPAPSLVSNFLPLSLPPPPSDWRRCLAPPSSCGPLALSPLPLRPPSGNQSLVSARCPPSLARPHTPTHAPSTLTACSPALTVPHLLACAACLPTPTTALRHRIIRNGTPTTRPLRRCIGLAGRREVGLSVAHAFILCSLIIICCVSLSVCVCRCNCAPPLPQAPVKKTGKKPAAAPSLGKKTTKKTANPLLEKKPKNFGIGE